MLAQILRIISRKLCSEWIQLERHNKSERDRVIMALRPDHVDQFKEDGGIYFKVLNTVSGRADLLAEMMLKLEECVLHHISADICGPDAIQWVCMCVSSQFKPCLYNANYKIQVIP